MTEFYAAGLIISLFLVYSIHLYNRLTCNKTSVEESWSELDGELKKRYDLIDQITGYLRMTYPNTSRILKDGFGICSAGRRAITVKEQEKAESDIGDFTGRIISVAEANPVIILDNHLQYLLESLILAGEEIEAAAMYYNACVQRYNRLLRTFPASRLAETFKMKNRQVIIIRKASFPVRIREEIKVS